MRNLLIVQGGGPTTVFNATLASVLRECESSSAFANVYGARSGMAGLCSGAIAALSDLSSVQVEALGRSPGAALGSSRFKPTEEDLHRACRFLRELDVQSIIFTGGNGTMRGAETFSKFCRENGRPVQIIGVPKTIDNDIQGTDRCPGFGSAARFVAQSLIDLTMDIRSLPQPVSIMETLGRDVGWIAGASTLAARGEDDSPHVVCLPETPFELDAFVARIENAVSRVGWAIGVVSEGTRYPDGTPVFEQHLPSRAGQTNRPLIGGVAQHLSGLVAQHTGLRCRSEKPGLIGRSSMAYVSAQDRLDAEVVGRNGVRALVAGESDKMVSLLPLNGNGEPETELVPLAQVAGSRAIPAGWLDPNGMGVNEACRRYMTQIVGPLDFYPTL